MFLPTGDTPNPRNYTAWINWLLIGLNVGVYLFISLPLSQRGVDPNDPLLQEYLELLRARLPDGASWRQVLGSITAYDLFIYEHGYKPGGAQWSDLISSLFLHANFAHLAGNMLFLWIYGDNVEHRLGRFGYLLIYLLTGIVATWSFSIFAGPSLTPLVGASGAISGVLGLYFLLFPRNKVKVLVLLFPIFFNVVLIPARWLLGVYILLENLLPVIAGAKTGVAYGAHIGGFLSGLIIAYFGEQSSWQWPWVGRLRKGRTDGPPPPRPSATAEGLASRLKRAIGQGDLRASFGLVSQASRRDLSQLTPQECITLAEWIEQARQPDPAARLLRGYIADHSGSPHLPELYLQLGLIRLRQDQLTSAYQHFLHALDYNPTPDTERLIREALRTIQPDQP